MRLSPARNSNVATGTFPAGITQCMRQFGLSAALLMLFILPSCISCSQRERTPEQIRQQTAEETAKLKENTKAIAKGIKEGLTRPDTVDLNKAPKSELEGLPGVTSAQAEKIIAARPFDNADQLVTRRILTQAQFEEVKNRVTVSHERR